MIPETSLYYRNAIAIPGNNVGPYYVGDWDTVVLEVNNTGATGVTISLQWIFDPNDLNFPISFSDDILINAGSNFKGNFAVKAPWVRISQDFGTGVTNQTYVARLWPTGLTIPTALSPPGAILNVTPNANGNSSLIDVSKWESLVISANSSVGAGGTLTVTITWFDAAGNNVMSAGGFFTTTLLIQSNAASLNGVKLRNLGPYVQFSWLAGPGTASIRAWTSNRATSYDGPYVGEIDGEILFSNASVMAANVSNTFSFGGTGATVQQQYCGPAIINLHTSGGFPAQARVETSTGEQCGAAVFGITGGALNFTAVPQEIWIPPKPFNLIVSNGSTGQTVTATLVGAG